MQFNKYYRKSCTYQQALEYAWKFEIGAHPNLAGFTLEDAFDPFREKMSAHTEDHYRKLTILILISICKRWLTPKAENKEILVVIVQYLLPERS